MEPTQSDDAEQIESEEEEEEEVVIVESDDDSDDQNPPVRHAELLGLPERYRPGSSTPIWQEAMAAAKSEGLTLLRCKSPPFTDMYPTGFVGVVYHAARSDDPYEATACPPTTDGNHREESLGHYATAESAALARARFCRQAMAAFLARPEKSPARTRPQAARLVQSSKVVRRQGLYKQFTRVTIGVAVVGAAWLASWLMGRLS